MALFRQSSVAEDPGSTVVAIDRDKNSQLAVKWAVDNLLSNRTSHCILIHVRNRSLHPQDVGLVSKDGRPPTEDELQQFFLPYRGFCARKGIVAKEVILHDIDVPSALIDYIVSNSICNIVVGASNRNAITRKFKDSDVPTCLLKSVPETCAVYVISKGRIKTSRPASRPQTPRSNAVTPRSSAVTPRSSAVTPRNSSLQAQLFNHTHGVSDFEDVIRKHFSDGSSNSASSDRVSLDKSTEFKQLMPPMVYRPGSTAKVGLTCNVTAGGLTSE